jgi:hypothetical protein
LDEDYCWGLLNSGSFGRVALSAQAMPVIVPVRYSVARRRVRFRPAGTAGIAGALVNNVVAFQADGFDDEICAAWSVHLVGRVIETEGAGFELRPSLIQGHWLTFF